MYLKKVQRSSRKGVDHKFKVVEAVAPSKEGDDMIQSARKHAAVHKRTG